MANVSLPNYLIAANTNSAANRGPWYKNTAPAYAGIFLSVPFMAGMAGGLAYGSISATIIGLVMGALFCLMIYYVPAKLGMQTGMPLYVVASSTFGAVGGIAIPGFLMGIVQIFWHAVFTTSAAGFFMEAIGKVPADNQALYWVVCAVWGLSMAFVGAIGIGLLAKLSSWLPIFPLVFIAIAAIANKDGLANFSTNVVVAQGVIGVAMSLAMFAALQSTAGFFASAGVAGADFGMNSKNEKDVALGGFFGVTVAAIVAGLLAILAIAGAAGKNPQIAAQISGGKAFDAFFASIAQTGSLAKLSAWVFVISCICPTGFCAFLASNAFATMLPKLPRVPMTLAAGLIGVILAATGIANNLISFFLMVGAAFGPIAGVMLADYIRSGGWKGPRKGINWAGYIAWAFGLVLGLLGVITKNKFGYGLEALIPMVAAAAAYFALAGFGLESETILLEKKNV
ncbi:MAG: cytosine permease [Planctomycetes bacterium]|nr:cytosine permease [Planctomycetota bacterium]